MHLRAMLPRGRALLALDAILVAWAVLWFVLGGAVAGEVRGLRQLSATVTQVGVALQQTGETVDGLSSVPLVGDRIGKTGQEIRDAGRSTVSSGRASRESIHNLSWMLWVFLAVIPTVPVLVLYLPTRIGLVREERALRRLVKEHGTSPALRRLLAQRALLTLPYTRLHELDANPFEDPQETVTQELAEAELTRLGLPSDTALG